MVLINQLLVIVRNRLESVLQGSHPQSDSWVTVANPVEMDGTTTAGLANKIVLALVSLQAQPTSSAFSQTRLEASGYFAVGRPRVILDGYLLVAPNFTGQNYLSGLGMLSQVVSYLQEVPVLTSEEVPELPKDCPRIAIEFVSLDFAQANNLMMIVGIKCFPFLLYRLRGLDLDGAAISGVAPVVVAVEARGRPGVPA
ncbi:MAG TPA: Pvc16 family protein [Allosphingosinicella sp.]|jgi:hypothetical protein